MCFVLFCVILYCFVVFCLVLCCFVLFCLVLYCFVVFAPKSNSRQLPGAAGSFPEVPLTSPNFELRDLLLKQALGPPRELREAAGSLREAARSLPGSLPRLLGDLEAPRELLGGSWGASRCSSGTSRSSSGAPGWLLGSLPRLLVLFCVVLCCFVLFCVVLYCFVLFCIVLCCFVLFCVVLYCFVVFCVVLVVFAPKSTSRQLLGAAKRLLGSLPRLLEIGRASCRKRV